MRSLLRCTVACAAALSSIGAVQAATSTPAEAACDGSSLSAAQLNAVFANPGVGGGAGYAGGDYQHVYALPDGRKLWLFQDVFFSADNDLRDSLTMAAHNAGLVQNGTCWSVVGGPKMNNYIGKSLTTPLQRWFWPLDGEIGADGALWVFMVEMRNPYGTGAAWGAAPASTWVARIDPSSLAVLSFAPAADTGSRLYGWSVTSDDTYSYLYGHCYRQFTNQVNSAAQFDSACMPHTFLARVPKGHFEMAPQYWTAGGWTTNQYGAQPLMTRGAANPMDVQRFGDVYVNVTKIDDWWGAWIYVDKAPTPWGPWESDQSIWVVNDRRCSQCGIYRAHLLPYLDDNGQMVLSWSNGGPFNLWQANSWLYRPSFRAISLPQYRVDAPVAGAGMQPRVPVRAVDTRSTGQRIRGGTFVKLPLAGKLAANAVGVVANLTAVNPARMGFLTAWPCGARMPVASVLNYRAGRVTANGVHVRLSPGQELCVYSSADADVIVDVVGSYVPTGGTGLHVLAAERVAETSQGSPLAAGTILTVPIAGRAGVPSTGVSAVTVTVASVEPTARGYLTVWPCDAQRPVVSTLNYFTGEQITNSATSPLSAAGTVCVYANVSTHVTVDIAAWWDAGGARAMLGQPVRAYDSRAGAIRVAGSTTAVQLGPFVPAGTTAVIGNTTVSGPTAAGALTVSACAALPVGASVSHDTAENRAGMAVVALSGTEEWCLTISAAAHLVVDVMVSF